MPACCRTTLMLTAWGGTTLPATPAVSSSARTRNSWWTWSRPTTERMSPTPSQKVKCSYVTDAMKSWVRGFFYKLSTLAAPEAMLDKAQNLFGILASKSTQFFGSNMIPRQFTGSSILKATKVCPNPKYSGTIRKCDLQCENTKLR